MKVVHRWEWSFGESGSYLGMAFWRKWFIFGNGLLEKVVHIWEWHFGESGSYLGMAFCERGSYLGMAF